MNKVYIAYDGRALSGDTDDASVIECIGERFTKQDYRTWVGHDAVLVEYDEDAGQLTNERIIGHWSEGFKALKSQCSSHNTRLNP